MVVNLKDLTSKITKGTTPSNMGESFADYGVMYFRSELLGKSKYIDKSHGLLYISESVHQKLKRSQIQKGDMLFSMAGAYLGKISLVGENDYPANTNQAVALIRPVPEKCNTDYLYYYMIQKSFNEYVCSFSAQAAQPNINLEQIGKLKIDLPSLPTQQKIASILSAYDSQIENNQKRIKLLEQMAENLYKEWFVRFRFPGYETAEFEGGVPNGWKKGKLKDVAQESGRAERKENRDIFQHYVPIDCIGGKSMVLEKIDTIENAESSLVSFKKTDILFGAMRPYFHKVTMAPFPGLTRSTCFVVSPKCETFRYYLYLLLFQKASIDYATTICVGSTMPYANWKDFSRMPIVIPSEEVASAFTDKLKPIIEAIESIYFSIDFLIKQRDLLLPRLMSGKLSI